MEAWRWIWVILTVTLALGEMFSGSFFLLPFAIGAGAAAALAWAGASVLVQWIVFVGLSVICLPLLRRYAHAQHARTDQTVGAERYRGLQAVVLEPIDPLENTGRVRVENEEWRATSSLPIAAGVVVTVTGVSGTRLVVEAPTPE